MVQGQPSTLQRQCTQATKFVLLCSRLHLQNTTGKLLSAAPADSTTVIMEPTELCPMAITSIQVAALPVCAGQIQHLNSRSSEEGTVTIIGCKDLLSAALKMPSGNAAFDLTHVGASMTKDAMKAKMTSSCVMQPPSVTRPHYLHQHQVVYTRWCTLRII